MKILLNWLLSALGLLIVAHLVSGFFVSGLVAALIAAVVVGLANATIGALLKLVTFPLTIVTFGIFWFVINAVILKLAAAFVPGFEIYGSGESEQCFGGRSQICRTAHQPGNILGQDVEHFAR